MAVALPTSGQKDCDALKMVVIGQMGAGKTSLIRRYVHNKFAGSYQSTIGLDFAMKSVDLDQGRQIKISFWDVAGQERYGHMTRLYFKDALAALVVFDVTSHESFRAVQHWKADLDKNVRLPKSDNVIPALLIANKIDKVVNGEIPVLSDEQLEAFVKEHGFIGYAKTSAKTRVGIDDALGTLVHKLIEGGYVVPREKKGVSLTERVPAAQESSCFMTCS